MNKYYQLLRCTVQDKGIVISDEEVHDYLSLRQYLQLSPNSDFYINLFKFTEEFKEYFDKNKSIKGYSGAAFNNKLIWDLDNEQNPDQARLDAIELLKNLQDEGVVVNNSVEVYYSGSKGIHIELSIDQEVTPEIMKAVCSGLASKLSTFDSCIYSTVRAWRLPNTRHQKTHLYKVPIDPQELIDLSIGQIRNLATKPRITQFKPIPFATAALISKYNVINKPSLTIVKPTFNQNQPNNHGIRGLDKIDFRKCPKNIPRCIYALQHGIMKLGERQLVLFRLATYYRNQGLLKEVTGRMLKGIAELNARIYPEAPHISKEEIWQQAIASAYKEGGSFKQIPGAIGIAADDNILQRYCECLNTSFKCTLHHRDSSSDTIFTMEEIADRFSKFAEEYDKNIVKTGIEFLDENVKLQVGSTYHLVGATSSGKTSLAMNILENSSKLNQHAYLFSLDTHQRMLYLKAAQKLTNYSQRQIFQFYKEQNLQKIAEIKKAVAMAYKNVTIDDATTLSLEQMKGRIIAKEEQTKSKIKLVIIDYMGRLSGPYTDLYATATFNALKSVEIANTLDIALFCIHQVSRSSGDSSTPLRTARCAKQSGDIEESGSAVITCWRPYAGLEHRDHVMRVYIAKNRTGRELPGILYWDGEKSLVRDMTPDELIEYDKPEDELKILKDRIMR